MNNDLAAILPSDLSVNVQQLKQFTGSDFLPYMKLFGSNSNEVKHGTVSRGVYGICKGKDNVVELSDTITIFPIHARPMAMDTSGGEIVVTHDADEDAFKEIVATANSGAKDTGCQYGLEFLLYVADTQEFVTFFAGSASARRSASTLVRFLQERKCVTASVGLAEKGKNVWEVSKYAECQTPPDIACGTEEIVAAVDKFNKSVKRVGNKEKAVDNQAAR